MWVCTSEAMRPWGIWPWICLSLFTRGSSAGKRRIKWFTVSFCWYTLGNKSSLNGGCYCCISSSRQFSKETSPPVHHRQSRTDQRKACVHVPLELRCWLQRLNGGQLHCRRVPCVDITHRTLWGNEVAMLGKSPQPHGWLMTSPAAITEEARGQLSGTCPPGDFYPIDCLPSIQPWEEEGPWDPWESSRACLELHLPQESFEQLPSSTGEHQQARPLDGLLWMIITALIQDGNTYSQPQCKQLCCTATKIGLDERDKGLE